MLSREFHEKKKTLADCAGTLRPRFLLIARLRRLYRTDRTPEKAETIVKYRYCGEDFCMQWWISRVCENPNRDLEDLTERLDWLEEQRGLIHDPALEAGN